MPEELYVKNETSLYVVLVQDYTRNEAREYQNKPFG